MNFWRWLMNFVPILQWLPKYNWKTDTLHDVIGGLTIGVMHIPQSIAYAVLAGADPVYGLYTSFFPVFFYMFFGTSKHASIGTFAVISIMAAVASNEIIQELKMNNTIVMNNTVISLTYVEVTTTLAFTIGIVEVSIQFFHFSSLLMIR
ncbi:hypothetical protein X798_06241 [Onchocerca flexuosa]|uniref:SLC26A/SulP transporter domain-containing protein n=1 Tax=Onchocerca flexuosa TaxID=387005 RepID=A0A238BQB5_9BILA|nr:hypothetical protein X798_06241 [Onchocerca flexuosa]